jgi:predicted dinucleotide-binding enzyme
MRFGVLGTGDVGQTLASGLLTLGHDVKLGSREVANEKAKAWMSKSGSRASIGTFAETAEFGERLLLCTLWSGTESVIRSANPANFKGKTVIDVTNPLKFAPNAPPELAIGHDDSGGEQVQRWLPGANVVKAFNTVGHPHMVHPRFAGGPPDMFIGGNDAGAKKHVTELLTAFGWSAIDLGGIEVSRYLEPMCIVWVYYGIRSGTWDHAFKLLRK